MKDSYMILVILAVLITPFLPGLLKGKCPHCGKRKLDALDSTAEESGPFITYFKCKACGTKFMRHKSEPLKPVEEP